MRNNNESNVEDKLNEAGKKTNDMFNNSVDTIKNQSEKLKNTVASYTNENPFGVIGSALLIGVIMGYLLKR